MNKLNIGVCGATGRMGSILVTMLEESDSISFSGGLSKGSDMSVKQLCEGSDIIIDFSSPDILEELLEEAQKHNTKLVICTTGFSDAQWQKLEEASQHIAVLYASNTSIGISIIKALSKQAATLLNDEYDIEILETHHRYKKDAPSGTSLSLGEAVAEARNIDFTTAKSTDRDTIRQKGEIGFTSVRGGSFKCDHNVMFIGNDEKVEISHSAFNKNIFPSGAIKAAKWLAKKPSGKLYSMEDVFCL